VPFQELISAIENEGADLMVMGRKVAVILQVFFSDQMPKKFSADARFRY
jgi:hypothetical protein